MKNFVIEKILNRKIASKNSDLENHCKKIGRSKKTLGQKVSMKNFSRKSEKIGLVGEKILYQKIRKKNVSWKIDEKNWSNRWKNSRSESRHEKLWSENRF